MEINFQELAKLVKSLEFKHVADDTIEEINLHIKRFEKFTKMIEFLYTEIHSLEIADKIVKILKKNPLERITIEEKILEPEEDILNYIIKYFIKNYYVIRSYIDEICKFKPDLDLFKSVTFQLNSYIDNERLSNYKSYLEGKDEDKDEDEDSRCEEYRIKKLKNFKDGFLQTMENTRDLILKCIKYTGALENKIENEKIKN